MRARTMICIAALLAAAGCGDGTGPRGLPGRFDLVRYQDWPLPAVLQVITVVPDAPGAPGTSCEKQLTSMTLDFTGGQYVVTTRTSVVCNDGRPATTSASSEEGTFTLTGDSLAMTASDTLPNGYSTHLWFASRAGSELRVYLQHTAVNFTEYLVDTRPLVFREAP